jgi:hypothetical protein
MKIKSISYAGKSDVFNMEVEDTHNFVIQGGVISHNCADESRYFLMTRPIKPRKAPKPDEFINSPLHTIFDLERDDLIRRTPIPKMEIIDGG